MFYCHCIYGSNIIQRGHSLDVIDNCSHHETCNDKSSFKSKGKTLYDMGLYSKLVCKNQTWQDDHQGHNIHFDLMVLFAILPLSTNKRICQTEDNNCHHI